MRLGGPVFLSEPDPERWAAELRRRGYGAAYCPVDESADAATVRAFARAAAQAEVVIAEVGVWNNPLHAQPAERQAAVELCCRRLALADEIGARCCVNIAGSRGPRWDGPDAANFSPETFDLIVATVRAILDAVQPKRADYTLETMPWMPPDSVQSYLDLLRAIDRPRFAVHLDPVNLITSPQRYFGHRALLRECVDRLGPHIRSCHIKDVRLAETLTVHLDEVRPGLGGLDYAVLLTEMNRLDPDLPLMLEHLPAEAEYAAAAEFVRGAAARAGLAFRGGAKPGTGDGR